ncbi:response regulator transcription factor [Vreelandella massiliensis]|uniref:response regulator transcription factor n=1 Tax=Vreelandella massiliensis TaxID=1816686 RepID=UPI00096A86CF|nr:response regulator transcription factor [Halomonas massiliensis]
MHLLLIEDETETLDALASYLRLHGWVVYEAATLQEADHFLQRAPVEMVVLDIELPDGCGLNWLQQNSATIKTAGLIIVSAHHQESTRLKGLSLGADVFLRKPLAARELALQLENLHARLSHWKVADHEATRWSLEPSQWQLTCPEGRRVSLTLSEIRLLKTVAHWAGQPVARPEIIKGLEADPVHYDERRLETLVRRLRQKVREVTDGQPLPLITVRGVGYAFKAEIQVVND